MRTDTTSPSLANCPRCQTSAQEPKVNQKNDDIQNLITNQNINRAMNRARRNIPPAKARRALNNVTQ